MKAAAFSVLVFLLKWSIITFHMLSILKRNSFGGFILNFGSEVRIIACIFKKLLF